MGHMQEAVASIQVGNLGIQAQQLQGKVELVMVGMPNAAATASAVWRVGRAIARTGLGPNRRVYRPPDAEPISAEDWDAYMQQAFRAEPVSVRLPLPHYVALRHSARMEMPPLRNSAATSWVQATIALSLKVLCRRKYGSSYWIFAAAC
eukprot:s4602_g1.t1